VEAAARAYLQAANKAAYELKCLAEEAARPLHADERVDRLFPGGY